MTKLAPCPFCGSPATAEYKALAYDVGCSVCDAVMDVGYEYEWQAIEAWNRRAPLPEAERATLTAQLQEAEQYVAEQQARIAELEQQLAQAQAGRYTIVPDGPLATPGTHLRDRTIWQKCSLNSGVLHGYTLADDEYLVRWQEGSEADAVSD